MPAVARAPPRGPWSVGIFGMISDHTKINFAEEALYNEKKWQKVWAKEAIAKQKKKIRCLFPEQPQVTSEPRCRLPPERLRTAPGPSVVPLAKRKVASAPSLATASMGSVDSRGGGDVHRGLAKQHITPLAPASEVASCADEPQLGAAQLSQGVGSSASRCKDCGLCQQIGPCCGRCMAGSATDAAAKARDFTSEQRPPTGQRLGLAPDGAGAARIARPSSAAELRWARQQKPAGAVSLAHNEPRVVVSWAPDVLTSQPFNAASGLQQGVSGGPSRPREFGQATSGVVFERPRSAPNGLKKGKSTAVSRRAVGGVRNSN
mmetsp:Transcript_84497/g.235722  ORF Transcript_84497/g.235722 Transcript_84497/m.235722 type:complete len:319 (-) Transcript_84497:143-1099(-)